MTFFMQLAFPDDHRWHGREASLFSCTSCFDETPAHGRAPGPPDQSWSDAERSGIVIDDAFLSANQAHDRVVLTSTEEAVARPDIEPRMEYQPLDQQPTSEPYPGLKVGGVPSWTENNVIYERATYRGERPVFLFQVPAGRKFRRLPSAPLRDDYPDSFPPMDPADIDQRYFDLHGGMAVFVFGVEDPRPRAFVMTSVRTAATKGSDANGGTT
jgi:hypothetical protein